MKRSKDAETKSSPGLSIESGMFCSSGTFDYDTHLANDNCGELVDYQLLRLKEVKFEVKRD